MATDVSSVTSHFPDAENGFTTTTAGTVASGATTVTLNSVAGYTNGMPVVLVIDPTDTTKKQTFTGIVDTAGVQITSVVWTAGTDQAHDLGATVVDYAAATHIAMISKGLLVSHNQDGLIKGNASFAATAGDIGGASVAWTPTYTCSGSMTFTPVVADVALWNKIGKLVFFRLYAQGTTGGTTSSVIIFTTPFTMVDSRNFPYAVYLIDTSGQVTGTAERLSTTTIGVMHADSGNWGIGTNRAISVSGFFEVA